MADLCSARLIRHWPDAVLLLKQGHVVALPTETVYGLAGDGYCADAVQKIYTLKGRPQTNPLILHYADVAHVQEDVEWTPWADLLAARFWPGPLTLVLEKKRIPGQNHKIPASVTAGQSSVAVRVSAHPLMQTIVQALGRPLAAPSANPSGYISPTSSDHVIRHLQVPVLDGGLCAHGVESTIIDARLHPESHAPHILRHGAITQEDISDCLNQTTVTPVPSAPPRSHNPSWFGFPESPPLAHAITPGQMPEHYAPRKPLRMNACHVDPHEGLLAFGPPLAQASIVYALSPDCDLSQAAQNLFAGLHHLDQDPRCQRIAVMPIPRHGLGAALNDRLRRACLGYTPDHAAP